MKAPIADLPIMPDCALYRRGDGTVWAKLNHAFHCPATYNAETETIQGAGMCQRLDPTEIVDVIDIPQQRATEAAG